MIEALFTIFYLLFTIYYSGVYSRYTLILFMSFNFPRANELMNGNALAGFISVHSKVLAVRT